MGMTITNFWKLFRYGVKRDHYDKLIGIREFLESLAQDCFNNNLSSDSGTPAKNIPLLDEVDDEYTVSNCRHFNFILLFLPPSLASYFSEKCEALL